MEVREAYHALVFQRRHCRIRYRMDPDPFTENCKITTRDECEHKRWMFYSCFEKQELCIILCSFVPIYTTSLPSFKISPFLSVIQTETRHSTCTQTPKQVYHLDEGKTR